LISWFLGIGKALIGFIFQETIFPSDIIQAVPSFTSPLILLLPSFHFLCFKFGILHFKPFLFSAFSSTAAPAVAANYDYGQYDQSTNHTHSNDQGLKVNPTYFPSSLLQSALGRRRQYLVDWIQ